MGINMSYKQDYNFSVGYYKFHEQENLNFQLNRLIANGARLEDIQSIAPNIKDFDEWKRELIALAEQALHENRILNAAFYYRSAEFFVSPDDPDKEDLYDRFIDLFYSANKNTLEEKVQIPFKNSFLPAIHLKNKENKGVILLHGGYDSFMEEYYLFASYIRDAGYEVILFEGPGQGSARIKNKLFMTHEWEKPIKAVLDYLNIDNVTLIGCSLGGYLGLRAAAFESRISKVVAFDIFYDFFYIIFQSSGGGEQSRKMVETFLKKEQVEILNKAGKMAMEQDLFTKWGIAQGMSVFGVNTPYEYFKNAKLYTTAEISKLVTCDVLLLAGTKDHFVPIEMFYKQIEALKNVKSLTCRLFTEKEHGANHCQVGNYKLVFDFILNWINITK